MRNRQIHACRDALSRSLFGRTPTIDHLVTICESQISQQRAQTPYYACRIEFIRQDNEFGTCCPNHCSTSPITQFRRLRKLRLLYDCRKRMYSVQCSCLYHSTFGIPCRHVLVVLKRLLPEHIHIRWHKKMMAHYKREGCGAETENIKAMLHERRLLVSFDEYQEMLSNTKYAEATHNSVLPEDFWKTDVMYSITTCTTVHCNDEGDDDDDDHYSIQVEDLFLGDGLSEEVCLTQGDEADDNSGGARRRQIHSVDYSSNLYESMKSCVHHCLSECRNHW